MQRKSGPLELTILRCSIMTLVLIVSFFTQSGNAHLYPGPISSSLGEAGIVNVDAVEGPFYNPAIMPQLKREFQTALLFGQGSTTETRDDRYWGVALTDCTKETFFPAAAAYVSSTTTFNGADPAEEKYFTLGSGMFVWKRISLGITLNRRETHLQLTEKLVQNNFSLGALWAVNGDLAVGAVAQNLANPGGEIPDYLQLATKAGFGFYYIYLQQFHFRGDLTQELRNNPSHQMTMSFGIDSRFTEYFAARLGYLRDNFRDRSILTAGFGFLGPRLSVSYGYQVENQRGSGSRHVIDLELPF